jgi:DNA-binding transcriptional ArsR family regulator
VRLLYLDGKTIGEMVEELDTTRQAIYQHLCVLRKAGLIEPREKHDAPAAAAPASTGDDDDAEDGEDGDALDKLRGEVMRQQGGVRSKAVHLVTAETHHHTHRVLVDRMGDGSTQPDETKHQHRIFRFVPSQADKHSHGLLVPRAEAA